MLKILKDSFKNWNKNDPMTHSAAIGYYTLFSLPALILIILSVGGIVLDDGVIRDSVTKYLNQILGGEEAKKFISLADDATEDTSKSENIWLLIFGILTIVITSSRLFLQLQKALNNVWGKREQKATFKELVKSKMSSFGIVLCMCFVIIVSLLVTSVITTFSESLDERISETYKALIHFGNFMISFLEISIVFSLIIKILPDKKVEPVPAIIGGIVATLLFMAGEYALSYYFDIAEPDSAYGAFGSIILMLIWVFYSSLMLLFGAEIAKVCQNEFGYDSKKKVKKVRLGKKSILFFLIIFIALGLIVARMYLPIWLKDYVNETLNNIDGYKGQVEDVDVALFRGAYQIEDLRLDKINNGIKSPFINADEIDISIQWKALFLGKIVSEIYISDAKLNLVKGSSGNYVQVGDDTDWTKPILELTQFEINFVKFDDSELTYKDYSASPDINLFIKNIDAKISNLRNISVKEEGLPSKFSLIGNSIGGGKLNVEGKLNILKEIPDVDLDIKLESVNLPDLNDYFRELIFLDFNEGNLSIYSEVEIEDGEISGYVKPLLTNLDVISLKDDSNPINLIWESIASTILEIFENQAEDQFATKAPLTGNINDVDTEYFPIIINILRNAFVESFSKKID